MANSRPAVDDTPTVRWQEPVWSADPPVSPGLYHHRDSGRPARVRLVAIRTDAGGQLVARFAHGECRVGDLTGEWAGPLAAGPD